MNTPRPPRLALTRPTRISRLSRLSLALLPALTLLQSSPAQAAVVRWVGADGEVWASPSNWNTGTLPGPLDEVQLGSFNTQITSNTVVGSVSGTGTLRLLSFGSNGLSLSGNSALGGLSLDGGSFSNSANTVISGQLLWRQGNISGSGLTRVSGAATLDLAGGGVLSGGHTLLLQGSSQVRTEGLNNFNALGISSNAHLVNAGSWLDLSRANTAFTNPIVGSLGHFDNQGSFTKASDTVTTFERGVQFNNSGSVHLAAGTLRIASDGSSSGSFHVAQGASLVFGPGAPVLNEVSSYSLGPALSNAGTVKIEFDGTVTAAQGLQLAGNTVVEGRLRLDGPSSFADLSLGAIGSISQSAEQVVTGTLNWSGGALNGPGSTRSTGVLQLGTPFKQLGGGHLLIAAGTTQQTVRGQIRMFGNSRILNLGTWTDQASGDTFISGGRFDNEGVFNKTTNTRTALGGNDGVFNNSGTIHIQAGNLHLFNSFNNQGLIQIASGATLHGEHVSFANAGTLAGSGSIQALEALSNTGTLAPGGIGQRGQLSLQGALEHSGRLLVDIGSGEADLLAVSGAVTLGGTLQLAVASDQRLARGSQFTVLSWGERRNDSQFDSLDFSQASGYRFATQYGANSLSLTVTGLPFNWTGAASGGFWDVTQNWNQGQDGLTQAGDTVQLGSADTVIRSTRSMAAATVNGSGTLTVNSGATLTLSDSASLGGLNYSGTLNNTGRVVVTGASILSGATLSGAGATRYEGALAIQGNTSVLQNGQTLEVAGTTTVQGNTATGLSASNGARIVNRGTWVDAASANSRLSGNSGSSAFDNLGSFTKASATTTTIGFFGLSFNNSGSVNVDAGTLSLVGNGASTGQIRIAGGATLDFAGSGASFDLNRDVSNAGSFQVRAGVINAAQGLALGGQTVFSNGTLNLGDDSQFDSFNFVGAGRLNNNAKLIITGPTTWGGGTFAGTGTTRLEGAVSLVGASSSHLSGGTLVLAGTTTHTGSGGININASGARLVNEGSWLDQAAGNVSIGGSGGTRFDNTGSYIKTGAFTTRIGTSGTAFNNTGTVRVEAGTLDFLGGGNSPGQFTVAAGATMQFSAGTMALGRSVGNLGSFRVGGDAIVNAAQGLELGGSTVVSAGRLNLGGNSQFERLDFVGSGTLATSGSLLVTGPTSWGGSVFAGAGTTRLEGPVSLVSASTNTVSGGTLVMAGTTTHTGSGSINLNASGSRLVNEGSWLDQAAGNISIGGSGGARFDNTGHYLKTGAFTTSIGTSGTAFNNTGTVDVQAGKLQVFSGFSNTGLMNIAAGAELQGNFSGFANAGTLAGDGTVRATDRLSNSGTLAAGGLNDAGTLTLIGGLTQETSGIFLVDLGGTAAGGFDVLSISGAASLTGTLAVNLLDGAHFNVGDSFTVMSWGQRLNNSQFASLDLTQAGGYGFTTEYGSNSLTLRVTTAVPEPGSWALMALGLLGLGCHLRRKPMPLTRAALALPAVAATGAALASRRRRTSASALTSTRATGAQA